MSGSVSTADPVADPSTASGVDEKTTEAPARLSITSLIEMDPITSYSAYISQWASEMKSYADKMLIKFLNERQQDVKFKVPSTVMLILPL